MSFGLPEISSSTIIGDRNYQQDFSLYTSNGNMLCAVLCDGMGGMESGETASDIGVRHVIQRFQEQPPTIDESDTWLKTVFAEADARVAALRTPSGTMGAGSTIIAVLIDKTCMQWGCVGDSRIYLLRNGVLSTLTRMHNYNLQLESLYRTGAISAEERIRETPRGEALISYLGVGGLPIIDTGTPFALNPDDIIIMCSDGLYKSLEDEQIQAIIEESGNNVKIMSDRLVDTAYRLAVGKQDNTTVIAIRIS